MSTVDQHILINLSQNLKVKSHNLQNIILTLEHNPLIHPIGSR